MKRQRKIGLTYPAVIAAAFVFAVLLNFLTPYIVDDFSYMRNFATKGPIEKLTDIFPSMAAHYFRMNGRTVPHFFAQLFVYLPKPVFNIVNGAMLAFLPAVILLFCREKQHRFNAVGYAAVFTAIWIFEPVFGVVNLWLTGACNYLWGTVFSLAFLLPFARAEMGESIINGMMPSAAFALFSLLAGGYSENTSAAVIGAALLLMIIVCLRGESEKLYPLVPAWLCAVVGYVVMALSPAGASAKIAGFSHLGEGMVIAAETYMRLYPLLIAYLISLAFFLFTGYEKRRIITSLVLFAASLAANFMMSFAMYYEERSLASPAVFLIGAILLSVSETIRSVPDGRGREKPKRICSCALAAVCAAALVFTVPKGFGDVLHTYREVGKGEKIIISAAESGADHAVIPMVYPKSRYSPLYGLKYIDTIDSQSWPNYAMALYYGIDNIIGTE